ncbi:tripartite tricarboxylate transporter permease [Siccirubricoccus phaeus]|uniref:tripartite tricarboxylate transporter permease n=1 Tax=Siccirubricoccus phaeus TaxID=2595053 RepID=UPI0011F2E659|nr:tripartite tricarboxylate transporter permease [Siccirubricoccus phaeus]
MENLLLGFGQVLTPAKLLWCFLGVFLGTVIGILPGLGPLATMAILLPMTFKMEVSSAIIMLCGIYYGVAYGGTATSVLMRIPGEASSVVTCLDGYMMARRGRAGAALGIAAIGSFFAGTVGTLAISYLSPPLARLVFAFGPAEYTMLMLAGLCAVTYFSGTSILRALLMAGLGLALGCIGPDPMTAEPRLSFGLVDLSGGIDIVSLAIGLFGVSELLFMARRRAEELQIIAPPARLLGFLPSRQEARRSAGPVARGTVLGFLIGVLPGGGAVFASFLSYALERKLSKRPEEFGTGAVEGVAGPESANNAGTAGAFVPLLCMGLPANAITAVLLNAFMVHGVSPGPAMIERQPELFWGIIASMYLGNLMLLVLNLPLIGLLVRVLEIPRAWLSPVILLLCLVGVYSSTGDASGVALCVAFGFLGYFLRRRGYDLGIVILAFVLGPIIERSVRQALTIADGDPAIFVQSPLALGLAVLVAVILAAGLWPRRPAVVPA